MLTDAIKKRSAVRKYLQSPLSDEVLSEVQAIICSQKPLFPNLKYKIDLVNDGQSFRHLLGGIIGSYGKVNAPHYLVASCEVKENAYENIGYLLEYVVLKLTEMNIGTCWIGGGIKKTLFADYLKLEDDLTPIVVIAFGYPIDNHQFRNDISQFKRKKIDQICLGEYKPYQEVMELVRLAPSAVNSQPWRYDFISKNQIDLYRVKNNFIMKNFIDEMNRIDMGISLCHFEIGIHHKRLELVDLKKVKKKFHYYKSIFF